ncbi:MAG: hypothetical protein WDO71_22745 [Bacteroidota bacterium]
MRSLFPLFSNTAELPLTNAPTAVINLTSEVTANNRPAQFLVVGIEFYQEGERDHVFAEE